MNRNPLPRRAPAGHHLLAIACQFCDWLGVVAWVVAGHLLAFITLT